MQLFDVDTVLDNVNGYTSVQIRHAKRARELQVSIGCTTDFLKALLQQPGTPIEANPVKLNDVKMAEDIFGKDVGALKGKTTRQQPGAVIDDSVYIPEEIYTKHPNIKLEIDVMYINGIATLTGIDATVFNRNFEPLKARTVPELLRALDTFLRYYNKAGYTIAQIECDNEFKPLLEQLEDNDDININLANPNDHVPHVERHNRTMKERIRTLFHGLPFNLFPKQLLLKMGERANMTLNYFPAKQGVSTTYSPHAIMTRKSLKYDDLKTPFGAYVQAYEDTKPHNSNKERTLDCLYLLPAANRQNGHELLHIHTGKVITRGQCTTVPITQAVITAVETRAKRDGMYKGLKIEGRPEHPITRADWIAGVDHQLHPQDDEDSDDEDYSSEEDDSEEEDYDSDEYDSEDEDESMTDDPAIAGVRSEVNTNPTSDETEVEDDTSISEDDTSISEDDDSTQSFDDPDLWNNRPKRSEASRAKPKLHTDQQMNNQASVPKSMCRQRKRQIEAKKSQGKSHQDACTQTNVQATEKSQRESCRQTSSKESETDDSKPPSVQRTGH